MVSENVQDGALCQPVPPGRGCDELAPGLKASVYVTPLRVKEATGPFWCHKVWETLGPQGRRQDGTYFPSPHACIDCSQSTRPGGPRTEHKEGEGEFAAERKDLK